MTINEHTQGYCLKLENQCTVWSLIYEVIEPDKDPPNQFSNLITGKIYVA